MNELAEVGFSSGCDAVGVVSEEHRVEISLHDLFFGAFFFEADCVGEL